MPSFDDLKAGVPNAWRFTPTWMRELINEIQATTIDLDTEQTLENKSFDTVGFLHQGSTPANPALGFTKMYIKSDGNPYILSSAGVERGMLFPSVFTSNSIGTFNDFAFGNASLIRMTNAGTTVLQGLLAGTPGQTVKIVSAGSGNVEIAHENAGSAVANRIINTVTSANTILAAGKGYAIYIYDGTSQRWRLVEHRQGASITYGVTWTAVSVNPAIGNGTLNGSYFIDGNTVKIFISLTAGTTTTFGTGAYRFSLPVAGIAGKLSAMMSGIATDASAGLSYVPAPAFISTTSLALFSNGIGQYSPTVPFTWATGDVITFYAEYQVT